MMMMMNGMGGMGGGQGMSQGMNQGMNMGMNGMNQGMGVMNHGAGAYNQMGNMAMANNGGMTNMPGMIPGSGFESILGNLAGIAITLLFWALLIGGTVFLVRGLWEMFKPKNTVATAPVVVAKQVEVLE
ncbi:hypothetical protein M7775_13435 [Sporomusa sphaeroides DSM 2875]|uniref:hypothetical protein n=1 Tax=Sporomusa sphaeroides TaxID=47679 RepID=UPI002030EED5|nr:hypothetical protein [Sporomusa sphaeroides]MCM0759555.1 hypothetical protein [Sporomusa sphaeroides DSM 2875]